MAIINRTQNATRNIVYGAMLKLYQIIVPFLMKTVINYFLGAEYLGLNSLFVSVLQTLNLAELGVGSALVFSMYKPIANDDKETICALMKLYRFYYRIIGIVIFVIGCILLPFIPMLIKGDIPAEINIYYLYLLQLLNTVLSYWLFSYRNCLFQAYQRTDITSKITMAINTVGYILQFIVLINFHDYYLYLFINIFVQIMINIVTAIISKKEYPDYMPIGNLPKNQVKEINKKIKDLFTAKLGGTLLNVIDTISISVFLGLIPLAKYQNYYYIMISVFGFVSIIFNACSAGIGNSLVVESSEKNYFDFKVLTFLICSVSSVCVVCFLNIYQPFIEIWMGSTMLLPYRDVILISIYFYIYCVIMLLCTYKDAAGIWHEDRYRPLVSSIVNLVINIILIKIIGISAVIVSSIVALGMVALPWLVYNIFSKLFNQDAKKYCFLLAKNIFIDVLIISICSLICGLIPNDSIVLLLFKLIIGVVISFVLILITFRKTKEYRAILQIINRITNYKFSKVISKL